MEVIGFLRQPVWKSSNRVGQSKRNFAYVPGHQTSQAGIFQPVDAIMKPESPMNA